MQGGIVSLKSNALTIRRRHTLEFMNERTKSWTNGD